jgi:dihydrofolate reductase
MKPKLLLITANLLMLLSISPQASYAADDPRVGKLLSQSGTALHVDALRSAEVIHVRPKNVGVDNDLAARGFDRIGAWIIGRNMFGPVRGPWPDDEWKEWWGGNPPFHTPAFVLTNHARSSIPMEGGTVFHFVTDGIRAALARATEAANGQDVRLGGGADTIRQYFRSGLIDEMHLAFAPVFLGAGAHLLHGIDCRRGWVKRKGQDHDQYKTAGRICGDNNCRHWNRYS